MIATTPILAELGKSQAGNANQELGDTKIVVPNLFQPVLHIPGPLGTVFTVPQAAVQNKSFIHHDAQIFTLDQNVTINTLGPGLWEISFRHWNMITGATGDSSAFSELQFVLVEGNNPVVFLSRIRAFSTDGSRVNQDRFWITIPKEQNVRFQHVIQNGAGTATFESNVVLTCLRFL